MSESSGLELVTNPMTRNHKNEPKLSHDVIDEKQKTELFELLTQKWFDKISTFTYLSKCSNYFLLHTLRK